MVVGLNGLLCAEDHGCWHLRRSLISRNLLDLWELFFKIPVLASKMLRHESQQSEKGKSRSIQRELYFMSDTKILHLDLRDDLLEGDLSAILKMRI